MRARGARGARGESAPACGPAPRRRVLQTERHAIALRFEHRCASCRVLLPVGWNLDHRVALADGGADDASNMQPLCMPCHTLKTARENSDRAHQAPMAPLRSAKRRRVSVPVPVPGPVSDSGGPRPNSANGAKGAKGAEGAQCHGPSGAVDMRRAIVLTEKCAANFGKWREKGESFRVDRYVRISGKSMSMLLLEKALVQKTRSAAARAPYGVSDLKHDLKCGFVELGVAL